MAQQNQNGDTNEMVTAVEWLMWELIDNGLLEEDATPDSMVFKKARRIEKEQHGNTWDAAIKAHDDRGHVHARSIVDFDEYFDDTFKK